MADEEQAGEAAEEGGKKKSRILKILLIILALLLVAGISAFTTWFLTKSDAPPPEEDLSEIESMPVGEQVVSPDSGTALYVALKPEFITGYKVGNRQRFLQMEVSVLARDQETIDTVTAHMPLIRNNLLDLLSVQDYETLKTNEGREQLLTLMTESVQEVIMNILGRPGVEKVLLRSYVMQ